MNTPRTKLLYAGQHMESIDGKIHFTRPCLIRREDPVKKPVKLPPVSDLPYMLALRPGRCIDQIEPAFDPLTLTNTARVILWDDGEVTALRTDGESRLLTSVEKLGVLGS